MKPGSTSFRQGLTLIELLVVIAIIAILAALILPAMNGNNTRATGTWCMINQKQIALSFMYWQDDIRDVYSWQVSTNNGGTMELIADHQAASQFQMISNLVGDPTVFICPTDKTKQAALKNRTLSNSNISYFVNVDAVQTTNGSKLILTGDRHLSADNKPVQPGLFIFTNGMKLSWTHELHGSIPDLPAGYLSFVDGHAERIAPRPPFESDVFTRQGLASARLLVP